MKTTREVDVRIGRGNYTIASDDGYLEHIGAVFEPDTVSAFEQLVPPGALVLDVGANIGCTAIALGQIADRVLAFEPSPTTYAFLERNVRHSGLANVTTLNFGLGSEAGEFTLTFSPGNRAGGFVSNLTQACGGHDIETIVVRTMDQSLASLKPSRLDFLKIDVEGFEGHVIRGGSETIARYRPVVMLELNHWCLNAFQRTSVPEFLDALRAVFPILLAVDGPTYMDLHDENESYIVMYHHILRMRYMTLVAGFDEARFVDFRASRRREPIS